MLVENKNDQRDIIAPTTLQAIVSSELVYKEISLIMQTTIQALQKVDSFAICQQAAIIKSNGLCTALSDSM